MGHAEHGHALFGQFDHHVQYFLDHLRVKGRGGLVKQHHVRVHAQRAGNGDPLLLATGELARILLRLFGDAYPLQVAHGLLFGFFARLFLYPHRGDTAVLQHREVREQVEVLEHHADATANLLDAFNILGQRHAAYRNLAFLMLF